MNLYLDDNSASRKLAASLRNFGHKVTIPADAGQAGKSDAKHLEYAIRQNLVLLTRDRADFSDLHDLVLASGGGHPGILLVYAEKDPRRNMTPRAIATAVSKLQASGLPLAGQLHSVNQWR